MNEYLAAERIQQRLIEIEFYHTIEVNSTGTIVNSTVLGPDGSLEGWELLDGHSNQYQYTGPWMHSSELISYSIACDVQENPGTYCLVTDEDCESWGIARKNN